MAQQQIQSQTQTQSTPKKAVKEQITAYKCTSCGAAHSPADKFCAECGMGLNGNSCVHCGAETQPNWEICTQCGGNLQAELCSFCGGKMTPDDAFCPECGNPRTGIVCPSCSTLNYRSFCRKCNTPLNALAQEALEEVRKNPKFQQAIAIAQELEELEQYLLTAAEDEAAPPELPELSEENKELVNQYKDLLAAFRGQKPEDIRQETPKPETPKPVSKPKISLSINIASREEAMEKYKAKLAEIQETINSMLPDPGTTPQMQRNYYSAVKVEIIKKISVRVVWVCNAYGCQHSQPNECSEPWKGGEWITKEETIKTWGYQ
ncbi:hypothetical protein FACS189434_10610 [Bacteroidia bacterium]|nr:hypothetical protein FACS189434_10610 [Bacteroidia bacterium]